MRKQGLLNPALRPAAARIILALGLLGCTAAGMLPLATPLPTLSFDPRQFQFGLRFRF
ncbi:MAG TPA: hypothetical protein VKD91_00050 [Pyrinomonadaceae bacterium]|nr:hypothetical protein [Pyrinomonadaceae bacterium]